MIISFIVILKNNVYLNQNVLQDWYKKMLDRAIVERVVIDYKVKVNWDEWWTEEREMDRFILGCDERLHWIIKFNQHWQIPYFEGDFWSNIIEESIKGERRRVLIKSVHWTRLKTRGLSRLELRSRRRRTKEERGGRSSKSNGRRRFWRSYRTWRSNRCESLNFFFSSNIEPSHPRLN